MKVLIIVLVVILVFMQYRLWVGDGSLAQIYQLKQQIKKQEAENMRLKERNKMLAAEVDALKNGSDAVEAKARSELGLIKEGETFYKVIEKKEREQ